MVIGCHYHTDNCEEEPQRQSHLQCPLDNYCLRSNKGGRHTYYDAKLSCHRNGSNLLSVELLEKMDQSHCAISEMNTKSSNLGVRRKMWLNNADVPSYYWLNGKCNQSLISVMIVVFI